MAQTSVVIIEDEATVRDTLAEHLKRRGCHVESAATAAEGLAHLAAKPADPSSRASPNP